MRAKPARLRSNPTTVVYKGRDTRNSEDNNHMSLNEVMERGGKALPSKPCTGGQEDKVRGLAEIPPGRQPCDTSVSLACKPPLLLLTPQTNTLKITNVFSLPSIRRSLLVVRLLLLIVALRARCCSRALRLS